MADPQPDTGAPEPGTAPIPAPAVKRPGMPLRLWLPLLLVWLAALYPLLLWLCYRDDPVRAVDIAVTVRREGERVLWVGSAIALLALLFYPPFPAWLRRAASRLRTRWSLDRTPLLRALSELKHFESAQRHYEVARLAWQRDELGLVGPHAQRAVELDPTSANALHLFGLYLLRLGQVREAHHLFAAAERVSPGHAFGDALLYAARTAYLGGAGDTALQLFGQHAREHGGGPRAHCWHGEALLAAGRRDEARDEYARAAAPPTIQLTAEENWFRAVARVRLLALGGKP